jgi:hypothetical protein
MPNKLMSEMSTDSSIAGTERLLAQGADGSVILVSAISAYVIDDLIDSTAATPTTGDYLIGFRGTDEKKMTLDNVAAYTVTYAWSAASTASPALTADSLLINRGGTVYDVTIDDLKTFVLVGVQATVLNTSGLDPATLTANDYFTVCQTTTAKSVQLSALETKLWTDYGAYVAGLGAVAVAADSNKFYVLEGSTPKYVTATVLEAYMLAELITETTLHSAVLDYLDTYTAALSAVTTPANTDLLYCTQGGTAKKLALLDLANYAVANAFELPWTEIPIALYTHDTDQTTPASTSTITMNDTSDFAVGLPVKYVYGGLTYYGIVTAVAANALLTIAGAPLVVASPITALHVGTPEMVTQIDFVTDWGSGVEDLFASVTYERHRWGKSAAYLVQFSATQGVADTGAEQPKLNVKVNGSVVSTNDTSKGLQLSATPGTWTDSSAIAIDTTTYKIERGEAIDLRCTVAGTNGDASVLSVTLVFVSE